MGGVGGVGGEGWWRDGGKWLLNAQNLLSLMKVFSQPSHNFLKGILLFRLKLAQAQV